MPRTRAAKRWRRRCEHQARATYLAFVRDHLTADAVYRLDAADLRMIDLVPLPRY